MRLTDKEITAIRLSAAEVFGSGAVVRIFGSRLDDNRRGGDIDLHVQLSNAGLASNRGRFLDLLTERVGEREYDVLVVAPGQSLSAIDRKALAEGVVI